jgi:hypothetical protein
LETGESDVYTKAKEDCSKAKAHHSVSLIILLFEDYEEISRKVYKG